MTQEVTQLRNVSVYWGTEDGLAAPDTPPCGFLGELCPDEPAEQECNLLFVWLSFNICFLFRLNHSEYSEIFLCIWLFFSRV